MAFGDLYARADALVPTDGGYALQETKASTFPLKKDKTTPAAPEDHHLDDVAIQAWVMEHEGLPLVRAELNLLNSQWRYPGGGDYSGLFRQLDVSALLAERKTKVPEWIARAQNVIHGTMPQITTGRHCSNPYPCPFLASCTKLDPPAPEHPIELLPDSAGKKLAQKLKESKGYVSLLEVPVSELTGSQSDLYRRIQSAHRTGKAILESAASATLNALPYPRYYFDFEGIDFPVPQWAGVRPYEQIPFQWSCHIERAPGKFEHADFLDLSGNDPSLPCIERMQEVIDQDDGGPIIVYFATYEKGRLEGLAERRPEYARLMEIYIGRLFDLLPVVKQNFYHPAMRGSFSIKKVLPVVAPDLTYDNLDGVQDGTGAQMAYLLSVFEPKTDVEKKLKLEQQLRTYCNQDTWAMVELGYFLANKGRPLKT